MFAFQTLCRRTAAALGAIAALTATGLATAQSVTLTGTSGSSCTYSQMTVLPNGNVAVQCSTTASPGTFTLTAPTSISTSSQTTASQVRVNRANGSLGAVDVGFTVSGTSTCTSSTQTPITFADGDLAAKPILIDTNATPGTCIVTLLAPSAGTLGSPSSRSMSVVDPDAPVTFAFATPSSSASIAGSNVSIVVNRSGGANNAWTVPVTLSGGLTAAGSLIAGTATTIPAGDPILLQFPASSASATITFDPANATPVSPALPASLVLTLGQPTTTAATTQTGSASGAHTLTLNGPPIGCPVPETNVDTIGGAGVLRLTRLASGTIATFALPTPTLAKVSGIFKLSETTVTWPLGAWSYEIHINKCKGLVQATPGSGCYGTSSNTTLFNKIWFTAFTTSFSTKAKMDLYGYCYAPPSEGPWYINIRYNYPAGCSTAPCGWHAQWTNYAY